MKRFLYPLYARLSSNQRWITRRFTPAGLLVFAGVVITGAIGADTNLSMAYRVFTLLATLLGCAVVASLLRRPEVEIERRLPRFGSAGEVLPYELRLHNRRRHPQRGLVLFENIPDPRPTRREFLESREPGEEQRNWYDRHTAFYRYSWLVSQKLMARAGEVRAQDCPPLTTISVPAELLPLRRGVLRFEGMAVTAPDPFGLFRSLRTLRLPQSMLILPKRYTLPAIAWPGTQKYQHGGVALASSVGESEEFVSLRDYRPGDSIRHIHWRSWARTGRPVVKEFQDEFFVRHALVLDTFGPLELHPAFEEAVSVAASFACGLHTQESLLDLMFVGAEAFTFTTGRGVAHVEQMLEVLAGVDLCVDQPFSVLKNLVLQHAGELSGCILILLKLDEERMNWVRQLQALGVPVMTLIVARPCDVPAMQAVLQRADAIPAHMLEVGQVKEGLMKLEG